jgi:hypothetical protein
MSESNMRVVKQVLAAAAAFVAVLALSASAGAAPVSLFREVATGAGVEAVRSDGVRFAWGQPRGFGARAVRVFDALRGRSFRLTAPRPECRFGSIGGGVAVWSCVSPETMLLTNLSTGRSREPEGVDQVKRMAEPLYIGCSPWSIGRYWLEFTCGNGFGPGGAPYFLNHRTGGLTGDLEIDAEFFSSGSPFFDVDFTGLIRPHCAPLKRAELSDYQPPFGLEQPRQTGTRFDSIRLRRCGTRRAEILSRCQFTDCRTPQLSSGYVTWAEHKRVYAYLPSITRRVLVGRAPTAFLRGRKLSVAHTCNRIFARWGFTIYAARFEPRRGAPPCQSRR